jgi:predicted AAA+ superfamily ATPase
MFRSAMGKLLFVSCLRETKTFQEIANYLMENISNTISYNRIKNIFNLGSMNTVKNYTEYLEITEDDDKELEVDGRKIIFKPLWKWLLDIA